MSDRKFILKGDKTTHGGTVITAWGESGPVPWSIDGIPVACVGDKVTCPQCKGVYTIIEGAANSDLAGKLMALHGCRVSCGAQVLAVQQHHATHENDAGELPALERAIARSEAERAAVAGVVANTSAKTTLAQADRVTEAVTEPRTPLCEGCLKKASQQGSFFLMV